MIYLSIILTDELFTNLLKILRKKSETLDAIRFVMHNYKHLI